MSLRRHHIGHDGLTLGNVTISESSETDLNDSSVVEDLGGDVGLLNGFLHVGHEELISSLVISGVHGVVVDVHEDRSCSKQRCFGRVDIRGESVYENSGRGEIATDGRDCGLQTLASGLGGSFTNVDENVGSAVDMFETTADDSGNGVRGVLSLEQTLSLDEGGV